MSNPYYTPSGVPVTQTRGVSANMRSEFDSVGVGFDDVYAEIVALAAAIGVPTNVTEVPVASSSTTDIGNNNGPVILITGTNAITSFGANYKGGIFIRFSGVLTLTHSSSLVLPGAANITTAAGDICIAVPIGNPANGWRVMAYCRMSKPLIDDDAIRASVNYANPSWLTALAWSKITGTPTTIAGYGITDAPTKTGTGASGDWSINITGAAASVHGRCRLSYQSGTALILTPYNGNTIIINGQVVTIPSAGVTIGPPGGSQLARYIYAYLNSGVLTLESSTTAYATDSVTGVVIKSGDPTRTLVGLARGGGNWSINDTNSACVLSYFNRREIVAANAFSMSRSTTSTSYVEVNSEIRCTWLTWADEPVKFSVNGSANNSSTTSTRTSIGVDGTTPEDVYSNTQGTTNSPVAISYSNYFSEGYHYSTILGAVTGGTGLWVGSGTAALRTTHQVIVMG